MQKRRRVNWVMSSALVSLLVRRQMPPVFAGLKADKANNDLTACRVIGSTPLAVLNGRWKS